MVGAYAARMYGTMYGNIARMRKTTVYLPDPLLARLKRVAAERDESEAEVIRAAIEEYTFRNGPRPGPLLIDAEGIPADLAERDEEYLAEGFGRD
jgi:Arc/MetJ-type ribon-helix-helix transcriptional regulator